MNSIKKNGVEFVGLYLVPGEGPVAALQDESGTNLFDKEGLHHRILDRQRIGYDTEAEEQALARINLNALH